MREISVRKIVLCALFAAMTCVATMVIRIPSLGMNGYVNIGDCMVLASAWVLGGWYGAFAAGFGSALADLLAGYAIYVPGTFAIKFLMALAAWSLRARVEKMTNKKMPGQLASSVIAEIIMVVGYLFFEAVILGYGAAAFPAVLSNVMQGLTNMVIALVLITALDKSHALKTLSSMG